MHEVPKHITDNCIPVPESGCWIWVGGWNSTSRYGRYRINGRYVDTHRLFYLMFKGEIPKGMHVCHKCDTPPCCNPDHLFVGTPADNMQDMIKKGRHNPAGRISDDKRSEIVAMLGFASNAEICKELNTTRSTVARLRRLYSIPNVATRTSTLTEADVMAIREARANGVLCDELAARYGVSQPTISQVAMRRSWRHL